jgi:hypothetical protein
MADDVARLVAVLEANVKGFTKGMDQAQRLADRRFGQIERRMRQSESAFAGFGKRIGGFLLGGAAIASITRFVSAVGDMAGKIQDTSDALGVGTDSLQTWQAGALQAGVRQEQFNKALENFASRLGEAQLKGGTFQKFLDGLGVGTKGNVEQVFFRLADAVKNTASQEQRAAIVKEAFGAKQVKLTSFIQRGSAAIQAQGVELARTGGIMSREAIAKIDELGDKWEELKRRFTVLGGNVLGGFADEFSKFADELTDPEFQEGLKNLGTLLADIVILTGKLAAGAGNIVGLLLPEGDEITQLTELIKQWKAVNFAPGSLGLRELESAEKRLRELLRKRAERAGLGPDFSIPTGAPKGGIDRTGTLNDAEEARKVVERTFADLAAAQADLAKATGQANAEELEGTVHHYEAVRREIYDTANAAIIAAEEKKKAEIAALDVTKLGREAYGKAVSNIEQTTAAEQATILEKRRGDLASANRQQYEDALALSRKLIDLEASTQDEMSDARRRLVTAQNETAEAVAIAEDRDADLLAIRRRSAEDAAILEEQAVQERLARDLADLVRQKEDLDRAGEQWAEYQQTKINLEQAAADKIAAIRQGLVTQSIQIDKQEKDQRLQAADQFFGSLATLSRSKSKELQAIGKAAAIVQATIDGVLAVQKALAAFPPPINFAVAAAVGAAAAVNVAEIAGMEHGGRVTAGTPYVVGEKRPELFVPDTNGQIIPRIPSASAVPGSANGGGVIMIDARGAQIGVHEQITRALSEAFPAWRGATIKYVERGLPRMMVKAQRDNL